MGCAGSTMARTPHLDALAAQGVRFGRHYVTNPVCMPSRASIFTGSHITEHGVWQNGCRLDPQAATIASLAEAGGCQTAHIGKLHLEPILNRIDGSHPYGFGHAEIAEGDQQLTHAADAHFAWMRRERPDLFLKYINEMYSNGHDRGYRSELPEEWHHSSFVSMRAEAWLREQRDPSRPFFLSLGYFDPHHAFNPCEPWWSRFADAPIEEPVFDESEFASKPPQYARWFASRRKTTRDPANMAGVIRAFHAMMAHVDDCVGRVVATVKALGLERDTIFLFSSDHGELLGNHGLLHKGPMLLDDLLRVPMIAARADGVHRGTACDGLTSAVDLLPTITGLLGAPTPSGREGLPLVDRDLHPLPTGGHTEVRAAWEDEGDLSSLRCLISGRHKLISYAGCTGEFTGQGELYDLEADPHELRNLFHDPAAAADRRHLEAQLAADALPTRPAVRKECGW